MSGWQKELPRKGRDRLLACSALLLAAGCGSDAATRLPALTELPTLPVVEELRIGSLDDPEVGFTRIGSVWESAAGELYVVERSEPELRVYDAEGALMRTYGREGEGPGEFQTMSDFGVLGDTVWISDSRHRRLTMFGKEGDVLGTVSASLEIPFGEFSGRPLQVTIYPGELRAGGVVVSEDLYARYPNLPDSVVQVPRVVFDLEGNLVDTLELVETSVSFRARMMTSQLGSSGQRRTAIRLDPPAPDSGTYRTSLDGDTTFVGWSVTDGSPAGRLEVTRTNAEGDTLARTDFAYEPRPVRPSEIDSMAVERARARNMSRHGRGGRPLAGAVPDRCGLGVTRRLDGAIFWQAARASEGSRSEAARARQPGRRIRSARDRPPRIHPTPWRTVR